MSVDSEKEKASISIMVGSRPLDEALKALEDWLQSNQIKHRLESELSGSITLRVSAKDALTVYRSLKEGELRELVWAVRV